MKRALLVVVILSSVAAAQSEPTSAPVAAPPAPAGPNPQAEALNDQGKTLFSDKKDYAAAADKFQQAIALQPDARYFYNLCYALEKLEQYDKAVQACDEVFSHSPPAGLGDKAGQKSAEIRGLMKDKGQAVPPPPPNVPPPSSQPVAAPVAKAPAEDEYKWSVGGELGVAIRAGLGNSTFNNVGLAAKAYANLMFGRTMGAQLMVGAMSLSGSSSENLVTNDYGIGLFAHVKVAHHLYLTPLVGADLSVKAPFADTSTLFLGPGVRGRVGLDILLNASDVLTVAPDFTLYFGSSKLAGSDAPSVYGLDKLGGAIMISVGYTRRSTTNFTASDLGLE
jgi:hypothetical protein